MPGGSSFSSAAGASSWNSSLSLLRTLPLLLSDPVSPAPWDPAPNYAPATEGTGVREAVCVLTNVTVASPVSAEPKQCAKSAPAPWDLAPNYAPATEGTGVREAVCALTNVTVASPVFAELKQCAQSAPTPWDLAPNHAPAC